MQRFPFISQQMSHQSCAKSHLHAEELRVSSSWSKLNPIVHAARGLFNNPNDLSW